MQLFEFIDHKKDIYLMTEHASGGDLFEKITSQGYLSESEAKRIFLQILSGLNYAHCKCVVHRDLKPENLLFDSSGVLKIADFGLCNNFKDG